MPDQPTGRVNLTLTEGQLRERFGLRVSERIDHIEWDPVRRSLSVIVESQWFQPVLEGCEPPRELFHN